MNSESKCNKFQKICGHFVSASVCYMILDKPATKLGQGITITPQWNSGISSLTYTHSLQRQLNSLKPRQNGRHFADDIFKCIFLNEDVWILIKISLKFVPKGLINNIPALVQILAWRRPGDKPLSEPMMVGLLTHIGLCVTRPQWVKLNIVEVRVWNGDYIRRKIMDVIPHPGSNLNWSLLAKRIIDLHWYKEVIAKSNTTF